MVVISDSSVRLQLTVSLRTGSVTLRVMPHEGITSECLPGPPATTTLMLSGSPVIGSR